MDIQTEIETLRDLAEDTDTDLMYPYRGATLAQLGRISEVFRRVLGEKPPRLVRVRAIAQLYGYDPQRFRTTEQLSIKGAGAFITWAFIQHRQDADLDTVPLREGAIEAIQWAVNVLSISAAEIAADEERHRTRQRQRSRERYARRKREAQVSNQVAG